MDGYETLLAMQFLYHWATCFFASWLCFGLMRSFYKGWGGWAISCGVGLTVTFAFASTIYEFEPALSLGGLKNGSTLLIPIMVFGSRFLVDRILRRWSAHGVNVPHVFVTVLLHILMPALLGYAAVQVTIDKEAARERATAWMTGVKLANRMQGDPEMRPLLDALIRNFPDDFDSLMQEFATQALQQRMLDNGRIQYAPFDFVSIVNQFAASRREHISNASDQSLVKLFRLGSEVFEALRDIPEFCLAATSGALTHLAEPRSGAFMEEASPAMRELLVSVTVANVEAHGEAARNPVERDMTNLSGLQQAVSEMPFPEQQLIEGYIPANAAEACDLQISVNDRIARLSDQEIALWVALLYSH